MSGTRTATVTDVLYVPAADDDAIQAAVEQACKDAIQLCRDQLRLHAGRYWDYCVLSYSHTVLPSGNPEQIRLLSTTVVEMTEAKH